MTITRFTLIGPSCVVKRLLFEFKIGVYSPRSPMR
jgi:hypothetical protein